jgi:hypothetical protein
MGESMTRIVATGETLAQLSSAQEPVVICNPEGQVIGRYTPAPLSAFQKDIPCPISQEEIQQRLAEPGRTTLHEIWKRLGNVA